MKVATFIFQLASNCHDFLKFAEANWINGSDWVIEQAVREQQKKTKEGLIIFLSLQSETLRIY
jgi:hypothetical protein